MSIKKQTLKSKPVCKVTFGLEKKEVSKATSVSLVGNFNNWSKTSTQLTKLKSGDFKLVMELPIGQEYEFRYLINGNTWMNDTTADKYVASGISEEQNCVIAL
ncbi:MAG: isoamylase early set domain-containing protein [Cyclobacteriaceae bacterium]|jgi:1,4-alpha-glucan branching enzyme|nr:isoamylase early set domain-containing protein [Cyclobacteriaceae bacterium]